MELKEIRVRQKREFSYDVSEDEYRDASPQKQHAVRLYCELDRLERLKRASALVSNYKFHKSYDGEYEFGSVTINVEDGDDKSNTVGLTLGNERREEKREVLKIMEKVFQQMVAEQEDKVAKLKCEIAND